MSKATMIAIVAALAVLLVACGQQAADQGTTPTVTSTPTPNPEIVAFRQGLGIPCIGYSRAVTVLFL